MARLKRSDALVAQRVDSKVLRPKPKQADPIYRSERYEEWREFVIARAGARCEAVVNDQRCTRAAPKHRMFADHKIELRDGGALFDPANGQCLCGRHHTLKTARARADWLAS